MVDRLYCGFGSARKTGIAFDKIPTVIKIRDHKMHLNHVPIALNDLSTHSSKHYMDWTKPVSFHGLEDKIFGNSTPIMVHNIMRVKPPAIFFLLHINFNLVIG